MLLDGWGCPHALAPPSVRLLEVSTTIYVFSDFAAIYESIELDRASCHSNAPILNKFWIHRLKDKLPLWQTWGGFIPCLSYTLCAPHSVLRPHTAWLHCSAVSLRHPRLPWPSNGAFLITFPSHLAPSCTAPLTICSFHRRPLFCYLFKASSPPLSPCRIPTDSFVPALSPRCLAMTTLLASHVPLQLTILRLH